MEEEWLPQGKKPGRQQGASPPQALSLAAASTSQGLASKASFGAKHDQPALLTSPFKSPAANGHCTPSQSLAQTSQITKLFSLGEKHESSGNHDIPAD